MGYLWLSKFPHISCVAAIGWLIVKGVGEAALLTSSSIISNSVSESISSSSFSISSMTSFLILYLNLSDHPHFLLVI